MSKRIRMRQATKPRWKPCTACREDDAEWSDPCGAYVCQNCGMHLGLVRCYCGWSLTRPGQGADELREMGEVIEFSESPEGYEARDKWARGYDDLNGAPEGENDR